MNMNHPYLLKTYSYDFANLPVIQKTGASVLKQHKAVLMESASGGDLEDGYKLHRKLIAKAMLEMFVVVDYMHSKNYLHSDFKPEQILLTAEGVSKLADLGMTCKSGSPDIAGS